MRFDPPVVQLPSDQSLSSIILHSGIYLQNTSTFTLASTSRYIDVIRGNGAGDEIHLPAATGGQMSLPVQIVEPSVGDLVFLKTR